jgi:hypothetical protein
MDWEISKDPPDDMDWETSKDPPDDMDWEISKDPSDNMDWEIIQDPPDDMDWEISKDLTKLHGNRSFGVAKKRCVITTTKPWLEFGCLCEQHSGPLV